ncbi:MAG: hypothetical protein IPP10_00910 [Candidatus Competibacteraceae bacterium]|nr:hypothetical protein [Candidatus Competibacteraceae bacterium]
MQTNRQTFASAAPLNFNSLWLEHESNWPTIQDIGLLACLAALFHDFGKANAAFQQKLLSADRRRMPTGMSGCRCGCLRCLFAVMELTTELG